jgi:hypothetical protein
LTLPTTAKVGGKVLGRNFWDEILPSPCHHLYLRLMGTWGLKVLEFSFSPNFINENCKLFSKKEMIRQGEM